MRFGILWEDTRTFFKQVLKKSETSSVTHILQKAFFKHALVKITLGMQKKLGGSLILVEKSKDMH